MSSAAFTDRSRQRIDDPRVEHRSAGADLAYGTRELVAVTDTVLEEVRVAGGTLAQQRDGVFGLVVLRQDHDSRSRVAHAHDPRRADPLVGEVRWHADIGHDNLGNVLGGAREQLVVVAGDPDDLEVPGDGEQGPDTFSNDEVVVRQDDADHRLGGHEPTLVSRAWVEMGLPPRSAEADLTFGRGPRTLDAGQRRAP